MAPPRRTRSPRALPPGRHGLPRSFVATNQRERILEGVAQVCRSLGYGEMAVSDITTAAGVSRKTFYEHFRNKEDAFLAAYDELAGRLLRHVRNALRMSRSFEDGVIRCLEAFLEFVASEPNFAHMCIVEVLAAGPDAIERRNETMGAFAGIIGRGVALGLPGRTPPQLTAETLVGGIFEIVYTRVLEGRAHELPELLPDFVFTIVLPYGGEESAERAVRAAEISISSG